MTELRKEYVVVLITTPDRAAAEEIAQVLVKARAAACVNILPGIQSVFHWEGEVAEEEEILLVVKTRRELVEEKVRPLVQEHHPYQVPEVIALPIVAGSRSYLDWIKGETQGE